MNGSATGINIREGWAVTASLVFHVGIVMILLTATVSSTSIKQKNEDIIHVSLASIKPVLKPVPLPVRENRNQESLRRLVQKPEAVHQEPVEAAPKPEMPLSEKPPLSHAMHHESAGPSSVALAASAGSETKNAVSLASFPKGPAVAPSTGHTSKGDISSAVPCYRENKPPEYPAVARLRGYEGIVMLAVEIFIDGTVGNSKIKSSSGYAVLDRTALETVKTWKFIPGKKAGKTVAMWVDVPIKFVLSKN